MRIGRVRVEGFRALNDFEIDFDPVTVLIGANGAGKSTVLDALDFFFNETTLSDSDLSHGHPKDVIAVRITFTDLDANDRRELGSYAGGEALTLERRWSHGQTKLTGRGRRYPGFRPIRDGTSATERRAAYSAFRQAHPELQLPPVRSDQEVHAELAKWEHANDVQCEDEDVEATHLFGIAGDEKLRARIRFVRVAASAEEGAIARQLLELIAQQRAQADVKTQEFRQKTQAQYRKIIESANRRRLRAISARLLRHLDYFLPGSRVELELLPAELRLPQVGIAIRTGELGELTELERQGHGFQRAFLIAALEMLAAEDVPSSTFRIVLGIEEPELYQHPTRLRRLARVLDALADRRSKPFQICYTTHSPLLLDQRKYERIRLLRRGGLNEPLRVAVRASAAAIAKKLGTEERDIDRRLARTLDAKFNEAFFARAVILTEGPTDAGAVVGAADRLGHDLDARGIAVLGGVGKSGLAVRWAVLAALEIQCFLVFDGDAGCAEKDKKENARLNRAIQSSLGVPEPVDFPDDTCADHFICFHEGLEKYLEVVAPAFRVRLNRLAGGIREKPTESYRKAVAGLQPVPPLLGHVVQRAIQSL